MSQQLAAGETFTDVSPGKTVTSTRLNNHVDGAELTNGAVIDQVTLARPTADTDWALLGDNSLPDTGAPAKVALPNLLPESVRHQTQLYAASSSANPATTYTITLTPQPTTWNAGKFFRFRADNPCAAGALIALTGVTGTKALVKYGGTALATGDIGAGQIVECIYDLVNDNVQVISPITSTPASAIPATSRNLLLQNNSGTPNTKVDITANPGAVMLLDSNNNSYVARNVNLTIDDTTVGANGLDTGTMAINTWYYVWLIYNSTTNTVAGLLSLSATAPTLPSGYSFSALLSAVRNTSGGNIRTFYQQGRDIFMPRQTIFTAKTSAAANTFESYSAGAGGSDVDLRTLIPPNAIRMRGVLGSTGTNTSQLMVAADANGIGAQECVGVNTAAFDTYNAACNYEIPIKTSQTFYWQSTDNTTARNRMQITGYSI